MQTRTSFPPADPFFDGNGASSSQFRLMVAQLSCLALRRRFPKEALWETRDWPGSNLAFVSCSLICVQLDNLPATYPLHMRGAKQLL